MVRSVGFASFLAVLLALGVPGCGLLDAGGGERRDAAPEAGADGPWSLEDPEDTQFEPGEWLHLRVEGIAPEDGRPMLWVGTEGERVFGFVSVRRAEPPPHDTGGEPVLLADGGVLPDAGAPPTDAGAGGGAWILSTPLPIVEPGTYTIGAGTADALQTRTVEIEVVMPTRRMPQADAAALVGDGLRAFVGGVRELVLDDDPEWQSFLAESLDETEMGELTAALDALDMVAMQAASDYMEIPEDQELVVQGAMDNAGLLPILEDARDGMPSMFHRPLVPPRIAALVHRPIQAVLFAFDLVSATLGVVGLAIDGIELLSAVVGALPATAASMAAKVVIATLKAIIETFVPTDLREIVTHAQSQLFHGEGSTFLHWGRFGAQNDSGGSALRSLEDLVLTVVGELIPAGKLEGVDLLLRDAWRYIYMRIPGAILDGVLEGEVHFVGVLTPIDMGAYAITLSDIFVLIPFYGPALNALSQLFYDPELRSPVRLKGYTPSWASNAELRVEYGEDLLAIDSIRYPSGDPTEQARVLIEPSGFRFSTIGTIVQIPWPEAVVGRDYAVTVRQAPDPADPNEVLADEDFVIGRVLDEDGSDRGWVSRRSPGLRRYELRFEDLLDSGPSDVSILSVLVDGEPQHTSVDIHETPVLAVDLQPGRNVVTIVAEDGGWDVCPNDTFFCVEVFVPYVENSDPHKALHLEEGASFDLVVWAPPTWD